MRKLFLAALVVALLAPPTAEASAPRKRELKTYSSLRFAVKDKHGARAPGRNIRRYGVKTSQGSRPATAAEVGRSIRTFRRWLAPPMGHAMPGDSTSSNPVYAGGRYSIPAAIVQCESGGNYGAVNPHNPARPAGAYQIITDTWLRNGGGKYAPTADAATPAQQDEIASNVWAGGAGRGQWAC